MIISGNLILARHLARTNTNRILGVKSKELLKSKMSHGTSLC